MTERGRVPSGRPRLTYVAHDIAEGVCTDGPRDDVRPGDGVIVQVDSMSDGSKRLSVRRDDENQHGVVEVSLSAAAWSALTTPASTPSPDTPNP